MSQETVKTLVQECRGLWKQFIEVEDGTPEEARIALELTNKQSELEDHLSDIYDTLRDMYHNHYEDYKINGLLRTEFGLPAEDSY